MAVLGFGLNQSADGVLCREQGSYVVIHGKDIYDLSFFITDVKCTGF